MATEKVGIYRKYYGPVPEDQDGNPLPKSEWPRKRRHRWIARWFGSEGKRYSKSFGSRKEAIRYAEEKQSEVRKGKIDPPRVITLEFFINEHKQVMKGQVACATLKIQMRALTLFADHVGRDRPLVKITPRQAESFIAQRLADGLAVSSVNKDIRTFKGVFNLAIEPRGHLAEGCNPFAKIKERRATPPDVDYVRSEDFLKVLQACPNLWWKNLLALAYTSGSRRNEMLNLTWANVDFENQNIRIIPKKAGEKLLEWEPKDHEIRVVPIPEQTLQMLVDLQSQADEASPYVFVGSERLQHILRRRAEGRWMPDNDLINNVSRDLDIIINQTNVARFTLHDLRRSCVTNWAKVLPIHVVQRLAGHSDIKTTQKYYLSVQDDDLNEARKLQAKMLGSDLTDPKLTPWTEIDAFSESAKNHKCLPSKGFTELGPVGIEPTTKGL